MSQSRRESQNDRVMCECWIMLLWVWYVERLATRPRRSHGGVVDDAFNLPLNDTTSGTSTAARCYGSNQWKRGEMMASLTVSRTTRYRSLSLPEPAYTSILNTPVSYLTSFTTTNWLNFQYFTVYFNTVPSTCVYKRECRGKLPLFCAEWLYDRQGGIFLHSFFIALLKLDAYIFAKCGELELKCYWRPDPQREGA